MPTKITQVVYYADEPSKESENPQSGCGSGRSAPDLVNAPDFCIKRIRSCGPLRVSKSE